jgi:hypothetical protein
MPLNRGTKRTPIATADPRLRPGRSSCRHLVDNCSIVGHPHLRAGREIMKLYTKCGQLRVALLLFTWSKIWIPVPCSEPSGQLSGMTFFRGNDRVVAYSTTSSVVESLCSRCPLWPKRAWRAQPALPLSSVLRLPAWVANPPYWPVALWGGGKDGRGAHAWSHRRPKYSNGR